MQAFNAVTGWQKTAIRRIFNPKHKRAMAGKRNG